MEQPIPSTLNRGNHVSVGMAVQAQGGFLIGKARLGYRGVRTVEGTLPRIDAAVAPALRQAFAMAADGAPLRAVTAALNGAGVRGARGGPVSLSTVQRVLTDPYYAGLTRNAAGRYVPSYHDALVSIEVFGKVQRALVGKRHGRRKISGALPD